MVAGAAALVIGYAITPVPDPNHLVTANATIVYYDDGKTQMGTFAARNRTTVTLTQISKAAQNAMIAAENRDLLDRPRRLADRHGPGAVERRPRRAHAGCVDDHPAVREELLPDRGPDV